MVEVFRSDKLYFDPLVLAKSDERVRYMLYLEQTYDVRYYVLEKVIQEHDKGGDEDVKDDGGRLQALEKQIEAQSLRQAEKVSKRKQELVQIFKEHLANERVDREDGEGRPKEGPEGDRLLRDIVAGKIEHKMYRKLLELSQ